MKKYHERSRENRFQKLNHIVKEMDSECLVIFKGQPFHGVITASHITWSVLGEKVWNYTVWIEEIGVTVFSWNANTEVISTGYF